ncbi:hypothetical protein BGW36DRAFT_288398 [Talaromyces proteolyticus]|uniref:Nucleoside phosphorylase domain-containing protein n=1 Tax=Talaromyces proteolyticus TaxID=1131652 RepID=A0AAD4KZH3_9EURO|nr:uncharacterized protein BGW36DRAFT_288398 [Talaromyces proteolyticus]KAH8703469.1 hypothetical protein BGW36DRAFT_288398 [Talaromyces proteolyticus]
MPIRKAGQTVQYLLGRIGPHNVEIAGFPASEFGIGIAASVATEVLRDFPDLEVGLLVGIAAGIPSPNHNIRLGDVAVAVPSDDTAGVIGYDMVKVEPEEIKLKQWQNASSPILRSTITNIRAQSEYEGNKFLGHLERFKGTSYKRPEAHVRSKQLAQAMREPCGPPAVHYGQILSGHRVIRSAKHRDDINRKYDAIAIEMEAAGMVNRLPVAVIRGISDFADTDKNDDCQFYAAANAAAYAKELLVQLQSSALAPPPRFVSPERMSQASLNLLLDQRAEDNPQKLDWRHSVVDLLKLLSLDATLEARKQLARRWNVFVGKDGDAVQNVALHGVITDDLAKNQGQVSRNLKEALFVDD